MPKSKRGTGARNARSGRGNSGGTGSRPSRPGQGGHGGGSKNPTLSSLILAQSPLIYWNMNESSGTTVVDSSGNGRNGTYTGSPTFNSAFVDGTTGPHFTGTQWARIADAAWMDISTITVIIFHEVDATSVQRCIVSRDLGAGQAAADRPWVISANTSGTISAFSNNQAGPIKNTTSTSAWSASSWKAFAWRYNNSTGAGSHWINGVKDNDYTGGGSMGTGAAPITVGAIGDNAIPALGAIRHFAMYGTLLADSAITAIHNRGLQP